MTGAPSARRRPWTLLLALLLGCGPDPGLRWTGGLLRRPAPGAAAALAGGSLENGGPGPARLVGAEAPGLRIELHTTTGGDGGPAGMRPVEALELGAGAALALGPGGPHLMLFGDPLPADDPGLVLVFADGRRVAAPLRPVDAWPEPGGGNAP